MQKAVSVIAPEPEEQPFWRLKTLEAMSAEEWESLCDGCGRCCLVKLEDEDTGEILYTDVGCTLLDDQACRCRDYDNRQAKVPDCVRLTPEAVRSLSWLPPKPAPTGSWPRGGISTGGIRSSPAIRRPFMRPESRCATGWPGLRRISASPSFWSASPTGPMERP